MKQKKLVSGLLAGMMAVSAVLANGLTVSAASNDVLIPQPVRTYSFENDLDGSTMYGKTMVEYQGEAAYVTGHEGQAVRLGDYGLKLNQPNIGEDYTISMWVNPSASVPVNGSLVYMGAPLGAEQQWVSVAGAPEGVVKVWTHDGVTGDFNDWSELISGLNLELNTWTLVTVTQSGQDLSIYFNGSLAGSGKAAVALNAEANDISIGVNNWDDIYQGLVDEVQLYDQALTAAQVYQLYDPRNAEDIFAENGFTVTERFSIYEEGSQKIEVNLPDGVTAEDADIYFRVMDDTVAAVAGDGTVTGLKEGNTTVKTTVTVGETTLEEETEITVVKKSSEREEGVVVDYTMTAAVDGILPDASGLGNDGTIVNPDTVRFVTDGDRDVMEITGNKSYVTLPIGIYDSLTDKEAFTIEAKYARSSKSGAASWLYCLGSIPRSTGTNYLFYAPYFQYSNGSIRAGIKNVSSEKLFDSSLILKNDQYYTVDMVFEKGKVSLYIDGIEAGTALDTGFSMKEIVEAGTKDGILGFLGKSCWSADSNFLGKIDAFKIYDKALTAEEIQLSDPAYQKAFQEKVNAAITEETFLGSKNTGTDNVMYDLTLPSVIDNLHVSWSAADETLISSGGKVYNKAKDQVTELTARVASGSLQAEKKFTVTVKALDTTVLTQKVEQANALELDIFTHKSAQALRDAVAAAAEVKTQTEADAAVAKIERAVQKLAFRPEYKDPWAVINASAPREEYICKAGTSETIYTIPDAVKNAVDMTYASDNQEVALYENGTVTATGCGTATLTTTIQAKSNGFTMEYTTYVIVGEKPEPQYKPGWKQENGTWYYYTESGKKTGWHFDASYNSWFYLWEDTGSMATGWLQLGDTWYYLKSNGAMATGWLQLGNTWYYLKSNGAMATGWIQLGSTWYYLKSNGAMATDWLQLGDTWYYLKNSGAMATGWSCLGSTWYYLKSSGAMATGWLQSGNIWYYLKDSGAMATGWQLTGNTWYYMRSNGSMATGWVKLGSTWYYLEGSGAMVTGWIRTGGHWYYLNSSGAMAVNQWVGNYYVNAKGVWTRTR